MSERKSWDVQPTKRSAVAPARPASRGAQLVDMPVRPVRVSPKPAAPRSAPKRPSPPPQGTLKQRRRKKRRVMRYVLLVLLLFVIAGAVYALWLPALRVQMVSAYGPGAEGAQQITSMQIQGTYFYLVPRNSVFILPQDSIRAAILDATPGASAVSITRTSFSAIEVRTTPRAKAFVWCGTSIDTPSADGSCYQADVEGYIFAPAALDSGMRPASTTATTTVSSEPLTGVREVRVFSPLDKDVSDGSSPIRAHIASAGHIIDALRFVDAIRELGAPVTSLAIRGDEADLWVNGPTRITYVIGHEKAAADLAASALPTLTLTDGSIQYVDLRFAGKAYVKRYGQ